MSLLSDRHRYFVLIPLFAAFIWFSTLLAMLLTWFVSGRPKYVSTQVAVAYISDVGASFLKPLFVVTCCLTGPGLVISLTIERLLRHKGRLPPEFHTYERIFGGLAIAGALIAMFGLAFLSGFDTARYPTEHLIFLLVFMVGVSLSSIFTVIEFRWLADDYPEVEKLKRAYISKAVIGLSLVVLAIMFGVSLFNAQNVGGVVEWLIAFGFTFYLLTFAYDLRMAKVGEGEVSQERRTEIH
ncbi:Frag1/DRAM/Sfk1 [Boletus reticuloceps]|uniref:Frag1/DRAM/Sfk1 n=1 Tax=Boletus reticuloceps TaxID=495285 RepID=A0A8I3A536_9AGAM|nr:Frag1/DRAM/Sfk1 [Boletus reticuloceps]